MGDHVKKHYVETVGTYISRGAHEDHLLSCGEDVVQLQIGELDCFDRRRSYKYRRLLQNFLEVPPDFGF